MYGEPLRRTSASASGVRVYLSHVEENGGWFKIAAKIPNIAPQGGAMIRRKLI